MTPEQFLRDKINRRIDENYDLSVTVKELTELLQEFGDLQKPKWIPIIDGDLSGLPDERVWITVNDGNGGVYINYHDGGWLKCISGISELISAWMPYIEPEPYKP